MHCEVSTFLRDSIYEVEYFVIEKSEFLQH